MREVNRYGTLSEITRHKKAACRKHIKSRKGRWNENILRQWQDENSIRLLRNSSDDNVARLMPMLRKLSEESSKASIDFLLFWPIKSLRKSDNAIRAIPSSPQPNRLRKFSTTQLSESSRIFALITLTSNQWHFTSEAAPQMLDVLNHNLWFMSPTRRARPFKAKSDFDEQKSSSRTNGFFKYMKLVKST